MATTLKTKTVLPRKAQAEEKRPAQEPVLAEERSEEIVMTSDDLQESMRSCMYERK
jgi:hypothetical protein